MTRRLALIATFMAATALSLWLWWRDGQLVRPPDAPPGKLDCVSYTPSHDQALTLTSVIKREQMAHDLKLLAGRFRCVRIYSVGNGLDQIPGVARELGLRVLLGLWIGPDPVLNQKEIRRGEQHGRHRRRHRGQRGAAAQGTHGRTTR